ncbi:MAG TPA: nuclear transport factor 2 family protein [Acidobacteriaceae bacterium]|nr:nuclear transport factor 2 family protein [Acidobacteriaceae bacterium]
MKRITSALKVVLLALVAALPAFAVTDPATDQQTVADLDTRYQAAVKNNDAATMGRILADNFVVVLGNGQTFTRDDLLNKARTREIQYEHQEDTDKTVRVWGNTAVMTAKLWLKGVDQGKPFDWHVWISDTYVRTPSGWRYFVGQASLPLPAKPAQ